MGGGGGGVQKEVLTCNPGVQYLDRSRPQEAEQSITVGLVARPTYMHMICAGIHVCVSLEELKYVGGGG